MTNQPLRHLTACSSAAADGAPQRTAVKSLRSCGRAAASATAACWAARSHSSDYAQPFSRLGRSSHSHLLGLDPSGFDDLRRAFTLTQHEARELGLRHSHRLTSVL